MVIDKTKPSVIIAGRVLPVIREQLETTTSVTQFEDLSGSNALLLDKALQTAEGLLSTASLTVNSALLEKAPQLKVISQPSVGVDNIDLAACSARKIPVGHTPGVLVEATADIAFGLLLSAARRIPESWNFVRSGTWGEGQSFPFGVDLYGKTLGIAGLGSIGVAVAKRAQASGLKIIYHNRHRRNDEDIIKATYVTFDELLAQSDFVLIMLPLTKESTHLFGPQEFAKMKKTAYLINAARGKVVDSDALYHALKTGEIAFAAMDVTDPEPLPADHKLLTLKNILVTPHIGSATHETRDVMARLAVKNLLQGLKGQTLPACANKEVNF